MGHAVYTNSDPRAVILKKFAKQLSEEKGMQKEFASVSYTHLDVYKRQLQM